MTLLTRTRRPEAPTFWHNELDDMFNSFFGNGSTSLTGRTWPAVDVINKDNQIEVRAEVPGMDPKDLNITVESGVLSISGEKKQVQEANEDNVYHRESVYGSFRRDIRLPSDVDEDHIDASYEKGILHLVCPKTDKSKTVKVKVKGQ